MYVSPDTRKQRMPFSEQEAQDVIFGPWGEYVEGLGFKALPLEESLPGPWSLYFIHAPRAHAIKIGISRNVAKRFQQIQQSSPEELTFLGWVPSGYALEQDMCEIMHPWRSRGEWFYLTFSVSRMLEIFGIRLDACYAPNDPMFKRFTQRPSPPSPQNDEVDPFG